VPRWGETLSSSSVCVEVKCAPSTAHLPFLNRSQTIHKDVCFRTYFYILTWLYSLRPYFPNNLFTSCCLTFWLYSVLAGTRSTVQQIQQRFHTAFTATSPMLLDILTQTWTYFSTPTCITSLAYLIFIYSRRNNSLRKVAFKGWKTGSDWHRTAAVFVLQPCANQFWSTWTEARARRL
jgi:hypothetical protein